MPCTLARMFAQMSTVFTGTTVALSVVGLEEGRLKVGGGAALLIVRYSISIGAETLARAEL